MQEPLAIVAAYGRVPFSGEYLGSVESELQGVLARWLSDGVASAMDRGGMDWREAFQRSRPQAFTFRMPAGAKSSSLLLGVIAASEDKFGRPFPLCVFTEMRESAHVAAAAALPVAAERFLAEGVEVCSFARATSTVSGILAEAEARRPPRFGECAQAAPDRGDWSFRKGTMEKLWASLFPAERALGATRALRALVETIVPMKTRGEIRTSRSVRLPLGQGGGAATAFWVEAIRALAGWTRTFPSTFWPADQAGGDAIVCLDEAPPSLFGQLWELRLPDPLVVDARGGPVGEIDDYRKILSEIDQIAASTTASVGDLFDALSRAGSGGISKG